MFRPPCCRGGCLRASERQTNVETRANQDIAELNSTNQTDASRTPLARVVDKQALTADGHTFTVVPDGGPAALTRIINTRSGRSSRSCEKAPRSRASAEAAGAHRRPAGQSACCVAARGALGTNRAGFADHDSNPENILVADLGHSKARPTNPNKTSVCSEGFNAPDRHKARESEKVHPLATVLFNIVSETPTS